MTDTERWVNEACDGIVASGHVRLYRDLYKDLRRSLPCVEACRLVAAGLRATRKSGAAARSPEWRLVGRRRVAALAALMRLARWATLRDSPYWLGLDGYYGRRELWW